MAKAKINFSEEDKKMRRREQNKISMKKARERMTNNDPTKHEETC